MPRQARNAPGGLVYHVLNRAVARLPLFQKDGDFLAFENRFCYHVINRGNRRAQVFHKG